MPEKYNSEINDESVESNPQYFAGKTIYGNKIYVDRADEVPTKELAIQINTNRALASDGNTSEVRFEASRKLDELMSVADRLGLDESEIQSYGSSFDDDIDEHDDFLSDDEIRSVSNARLDELIKSSADELGSLDDYLFFKQRVPVSYSGTSESLLARSKCGRIESDYDIELKSDINKLSSYLHKLADEYNRRKIAAGDPFDEFADDPFEEFTEEYYPDDWQPSVRTGYDDWDEPPGIKDDYSYDNQASRPKDFDDWDVPEEFDDWNEFNNERDAIPWEISDNIDEPTKDIPDAISTRGLSRSERRALQRERMRNMRGQSTPDADQAFDDARRDFTHKSQRDNLFDNTMSDAAQYPKIYDEHDKRGYPEDDTITDIVFGDVVGQDYDNDGVPYAVETPDRPVQNYTSVFETSNDYEYMTNNNQDRMDNIRRNLDNRFSNSAIMSEIARNRLSKRMEQSENAGEALQRAKILEDAKSFGRGRVMSGRRGRVDIDDYTNDYESMENNSVSEPSFYRNGVMAKAMGKT